jgi:hypothetical protein
VRGETLTAQNAGSGDTPAQAKNGLAAGPRPDTEAQAKARAALREEGAMLAVTEEGYTQAQVAPEMAAAAQADTESQAKARAVVRAEAVATATPVVAAAGEPQPETKASPAKPPVRQQAPNPLTDGMTPPESPFSPEQQAALARLLEPYLADQMSTEDYHQQRAAIVKGS